MTYVPPASFWNQLPSGVALNGSTPYGPTAPQFGPFGPTPTGPTYGPSAPSYGPFSPQQLPATGWQRALPSLPQGGIRGLLGKGRALTKGKIGPAIGYELAGQAAAAGLASAFKDEPKQAIAPWSAALKGAGTGAAIGSVVPGLGTLIGGLTGATIGEGWSLMRGNDLPKMKVTKVRERPTAMIVEATKAMGLGKKAQHRAVKDYRKAFRIASVGATKPKARMAAANRALQSVMGDLNAQYQEKQAGGARGMKQGLAAQALAQQFLGPILAQQGASNEALAGLQEGMAGSLPPEYQNLARVQGATTRSAQNNMAAAYANQMALVPGLKALELKQSQEAQLAQQAYQAQLQGETDSGGGSQSLDDALKQNGAGK